MTRALSALADGTVKQVNVFTGTEVWTVPGRADRPLISQERTKRPVAPGQAKSLCAFCERRRWETPPEKARVVQSAGRWEVLREVPAAELDATRAEFRLVPNLFEIMSLDYWRTNYGFTLAPRDLARRRAYVASPDGRAHLARLIDAHRPQLAVADDEALAASSILGGFHDVVIARRHLVDGARFDDQLASSGTLTPQEHEQYIAFTLEAARRLYAGNPFARDVVIFQNWLRPAGASFDHLHKQLVAIDELGASRIKDIRSVAAHPDVLQDYQRLLRAEHLVIAQTESADLVAGVGHHYPSLEVWTRRLSCDLWTITPDELADLSALLHAAHVAMSRRLPANEEWHYRPPTMPSQLPIRVVLKWRISNPAGFEGGSGIYINTIDPWTVAQRTRAWLEKKSDRLSTRVRITS